jgi:hypothetical protein
VHERLRSPAPPINIPNQAAFIESGGHHQLSLDEMIYVEKQQQQQHQQRRK